MGKTSSRVEINPKQLFELTRFLACIPMYHWNARKIAELLIKDGWTKG